MGEYSRYDLSESIGVCNRDRDGGSALDANTVKAVLKAWGESPDGEWEGGFLLELTSGGYAYIEGWCDYTGWGCQDGGTLQYADNIKDLNLGKHKWDELPADLNLWVKSGMKDDDAL